ncbi:TnpV protein [Eubacterium sp. am_0171]|uniref:TnpV protein n=1 Tax=unclassified Eubacterium (in: firmicutes) TaxID=2624479 RepID=UPI0010211B04|nr:MULTISPECIES: TnpV protein [unclassified Eubacterium (in: firmicutes)]MSC85258.1 TnpV protein [Eubacterium sp. BIOML-A1]MSD07736.1 TnpV protein [Eubacterium sp. BIOML-A2]RYT14082.1 TnpV protein [Eubacterium sp. am_0171]
MKSIFEQMGGTYRREGDYLLPNLSLPPDAEDYQVGKYGRMRKQYLKEHRRALYTCMMTDGTLWKHLVEIDRSCNDRLEIIEKALMKQEGVTEALKAANQMEWVRRRNSIRNRAEEVILTELVYA